jgi:hypothetical protein
MITPHFNDQGATSDPENLCTDLANGLQAIHPHTGEVRVTAYDAEGTKPVYPEAEVIINKGLTQTTTSPRELAMCLSFFSARNQPRRRGRLYIPLFFLGVSGGSLRPGMPIANMASLVTLFKDLGGVDVDWSVYSTMDKVARAVTDWWYDDEWDVMRSRGLKGSTRITGTTDEDTAAAQVIPLQVPAAGG